MFSPVCFRLFDGLIACLLARLLVCFVWLVFVVVVVCLFVLFCLGLVWLFLVGFVMWCFCSSCCWGLLLFSSSFFFFSFFFWGGGGVALILVCAQAGFETGIFPSRSGRLNTSKVIPELEKEMVYLMGEVFL